MAYYQARSMETYCPGALFGSSIDTPVNPRNTMILDLGEEGAFVCHSGRGLPFVSVDRLSVEVLRIDWVPIRKINEHIDNDARLTLDLPEAREAVQEAGFKVSVSRRVCDPSLIGVADKAEDELFDLLGRVETEADALNDFSCNYDSEFPNDTGESGLLDRARTQARTLWLLRKKMNERWNCDTARPAGMDEGFVISVGRSDRTSRRSSMTAGSMTPRSKTSVSFWPISDSTLTAMPTTAVC